MQPFFFSSFHIQRDVMAARARVLRQNACPRIIFIVTCDVAILLIEVICHCYQKTFDGNFEAKCIKIT